MLGRRHYRIKVFQALYAWFQGGETRIEVAEKNLLQSIDKLYELFFLQLSFFEEIVDFYRRRMEDAKYKFLPTAEELNPNTKFLENRLFSNIFLNKDYRHRLSNYKFNWSEDQEMIRKIFQKIRNSKDLKEYLESGESGYEEDRQIIEKIFRKFISRSGDLQVYCEEKNIHWTNDFNTSSVLIMKTLQALPETFDQNDSFSGLIMKAEDDEPQEEMKFVTGLFRNTITHSDEFVQMIEGKTKNWEIERIALTDIILIKMALSELLHFPTIPIKVTLNEYIDISKNFSTPKSKLFINGILDKLVEALNADDRIKKRGRGLVN